MNLKKVYLIILNFFCLFLFINTAVANNIKNSAVVFMYHKFDVPKYPSTNITLEQFESHLKEISLSKYNVLSLNYIVDTIINDGILPDKTIGLSVDDADKSFFTLWKWTFMGSIVLFIFYLPIKPYDSLTASKGTENTIEKKGKSNNTKFLCIYRPHLFNFWNIVLQHIFNTYF
mgnify:CR=1 FL=1